MSSRRVSTCDKPTAAKRVAHIVVILLDDAGRDEHSARLQARRNGRRQFDDRVRQDVGDDQIAILRLPVERGQFQNLYRVAQVR